MKKKLYAGTTSHIERVFIQDTTQTDGRGLTGLAFNTASLTAYYIRQGEASATAISLVTATVGTWVSGGFVEIDATNMPGWYELHVPNAVIAAGAKSVGIHLKGAANMAPYPIELELDAVNYQDAADLGVTALTGHTPQTGDSYARIGANGAGLTDVASAVNLAIVAGYLDTEVQAIKAKTDNLPASPAATGDAMTLATDAVSAAALAADAVAEIQSGLATSANQTTILNRLGAWTGSARNTLLGALQALFRKDADATVPSDINADLGAGVGTADNTTDSTQAIRDRGDAAWTTGGGVSGSNAVTFTVRDSVSLANLIDVAVVVYGADGTTVVDTKRTNGSGQAVFSLDSASYFYALPPTAGYSSVANTALTVDGVEAVTVGMVAIAATSVSAGTRVVRVIVVNGSGALQSGITVTARLVEEKSSIANAFPLTTVVSGTTDANGKVDLTLITSDQFAEGTGAYSIEIPGAATRQLAIPAGSGVLNLQVQVTS